MNQARALNAGVFLELLGDLLSAGLKEAISADSRSETPADGERDERGKKDEKKEKATALPCAVPVGSPPLPLALGVDPNQAPEPAGAAPSGGENVPPVEAPVVPAKPEAAPAPAPAEADNSLAGHPVPPVDTPQEQADPRLLATANLVFAARLLEETGDQQPLVPENSPIAETKAPDITPTSVISGQEQRAPEKAVAIEAKPAQIADPQVEARADVEQPAAKPLKEKTIETAHENRPENPKPEPAPAQQGASPAMELATTPHPVKLASDAGPSPARSTPSAHLPAAIPEAGLPADQATLVKSEPAHEISLVVAGKKQEGVEVRVVERAGEVRVAVRTADADLARDLRQDLNQLVTRLEEKGYRTETWRPAEASGSSFSNRREDRGASGETAQGFSEGGTDRGGGEQPDSDRQQKDRPRWLQELEQTLGREW